MYQLLTPPTLPVNWRCAPPSFFTHYLLPTFPPSPYMFPYTTVYLLRSWCLPGRCSLSAFHYHTFFSCLRRGSNYCRRLYHPCTLRGSACPIACTAYDVPALPYRFRACLLPRVTFPTSSPATACLHYRRRATTHDAGRCRTLCRARCDAYARRVTFYCCAGMAHVPLPCLRLPLRITAFPALLTYYYRPYYSVPFTPACYHHDVCVAVGVPRATGTLAVTTASAPPPAFACPRCLFVHTRSVTFRRWRACLLAPLPYHFAYRAARPRSTQHRYACDARHSPAFLRSP